MLNYFLEFQSSVSGDGPPCTKLSRRVVYRPDYLDATAAVWRNPPALLQVADLPMAGSRAYRQKDCSAELRKWILTGQWISEVRSCA